MHDLDRHAPLATRASASSPRSSWRSACWSRCTSSVISGSRARLGIRVLRFSIGFGKPLYRRMIGKDDPVEFVIASIPLGGYVKLLDEREGNVAERDLPRAFNRQPVWKRIADAAGGPRDEHDFRNRAVLGVVFRGRTGAQADRSARSLPDSIAARAGLRFEDEIVEVGGTPDADAGSCDAGDPRGPDRRRHHRHARARRRWLGARRVARRRRRAAVS